MNNHKEEILKADLEGVKDLAEYMLELAENREDLQDQVKQLIKSTERMLRILK